MAKVSWHSFKSKESPKLVKEACVLRVTKTKWKQCLIIQSYIDHLHNAEIRLDCPEDLNAIAGVQLRIGPFDDQLAAPPSFHASFVGL